MANDKKTLYVGGLADEVDENMVRSSFLPFGHVVDVTMPLDYSKVPKHKGFAFVQYLYPEDAADAIDNMDNAEILGKVIRVNLAKPSRLSANSSKPIWAESDYLNKDDDDDDNGAEEADNGKGVGGKEADEEEGDKDDGDE